jgi:hypothetical protein
LSRSDFGGAADADPTEKEPAMVKARAEYKSVLMVASLLFGGLLSVAR